jgi:chromosome segregation ATPase
MFDTEKITLQNELSNYKYELELLNEKIELFESSTLKKEKRISFLSNKINEIQQENSELKNKTFRYDIKYQENYDKMNKLNNISINNSLTDLHAKLSNIQKQKYNSELSLNNYN